MSEPTAVESGRELREATLGNLWRQWKAVGATVSSDRSARIIVDPEALILMSLWMLKVEQRLADVVWSWVHVNSSLLSIQRLRNLRESFPPEVGRRLSALATDRVLKAKDPRWKSLRSTESDELGARNTKVRAVQPRLITFETLMLQLRLGLGVGVKADALTLILGTNQARPEWLSVSTIADALGYTPTAVRRAVDDLARAKFIKALDTVEGEQVSQRMFSGPAAPWAALLGVGTHLPGWGYWWERYRFVIDALTLLHREETTPTSAYARDVKAREILTRHGPTLWKDNILDSQEFAVADLNEQYLVSVCKGFRGWLANYG